MTLLRSSFGQTMSCLRPTTAASGWILPAIGITIRNPSDWGNVLAIFGIWEQCVSSITFPASYHYALGDATNAYSRSKLRCFTRELVYIPGG